jgi:3-hydroxyisobutyrate dehydrogenase-like beta-hydroxyacid dehydrogenase
LRFSLANAQKDLGYYQTMAQDAGAYEAVASAVLATLNVGAAHASARAWVPELVRVLSEA